MIALGVLLWTQPQYHALLGVALVLTALASFLYTNLGGFLLGFLLGMLPDYGYRGRLPAAGVAAVG